MDSVQSPSQAAERVRLERDRHVAFAFAAADLLIETDGAYAIVAASGAAQAVLGLSLRDLIGKDVAAIVTDSERPLLRRLLNQVHQLGRIDPVAINLLRTDGSATRILFGACRLPNHPSRIFLSVALLPGALAPVVQPRDTETGLLTADGLHAAAQRSSGDEGAGARQLKLVRLDGLSGAVRQLPTERGALLMQEIGAALRAVSIGGDAAGRLGDDTFGIVTRAAHPPERDAALFTDLREALRGAGVPEGQVGPRITGMDLSLGTLSDGEAGRALTYAMNSFVNARADAFRIGSLQAGLAAAVNETVTRFAETRRMIADRRFALVYQPVVNLAARTVHHYEALSRFVGKANTFEMVGFMEDVGLAAELDLAVCKGAIAALEQNPTAKLAVNLSGRSIQNDASRTALSELITPLTGLRQRLLFELTESAAVDDLEGAAAFLGWLRQLGHAVCLDDFGAGAAAYSYLRRFDVDFVKIDGPFLKAAVEQGRERALIRSICVLCHEIDCKVIGEMIENEKGLAVATSLGVDYGQGWLFGKPMDELPKPVRSQRRKGSVETWQ